VPFANIEKDEEWRYVVDTYGTLGYDEGTGGDRTHVMSPAEGTVTWTGSNATLTES
jgi:hypothetical protein